MTFDFRSHLRKAMKDIFSLQCFVLLYLYIDEKRNSVISQYFQEYGCYIKVLAFHLSSLHHTFYGLNIIEGEAAFWDDLFIY